MADQLLTTPEAGRVLGIEPEDIYRLIFELDGKPDRTGQVKISAAEVERYRLAHAGT